MATRTHGRIAAALGLLGAVAFGFWMGRGPQSAVAAPPPPAAPAATPSDYSQRVVAYIYGSIPITREDLGEYLIARHGMDTVELLVNKRIIEHACDKAGVTVTEAEVEAAILADCATIQIDRAQFIANVVKKNFGKTVYEWKEDVIKPRLLLTKLVKDKITVTDDDLKKAFDATYGEQREVRIIIWPDKEKRIALQEYDDVRKDEQGFERKARSQSTATLAATGGRIKPIAHNAGVHEQVERAAFTLQPGEVSSLIETPEGIVVLKMDKVVPPNTTVKLEDKREDLRKEVYEKKVTAEIPVVFKKMRDEAKPVMILKRANDPASIKEAAAEELKQDGVIKPASAGPPR
jgi:hypothetical protein